MSRLNAGEIELSRGQGGEFGGGLVDHYENEPFQPWRAPQRSWEGAVGREYPTPIGLMGDEAKGAIADGCAVPVRLPQFGRGDICQQMRREDCQIGQQVGKSGLRA